MLQRIALALCCTLTLSTAARSADSASGSGALALAALVGLHSPSVSASNKAVLAHMLDSKLVFAFPANAKIKVTAKSVTCRASDVDISAHDCTLKFGSASPSLSGRMAHEIYATLIENGVASDGAAGSIFEAISNLSCTVDPNEVKQRGGGGVDCTYVAGPGS